jgi:hypothetical protein
VLLVVVIVGVVAATGTPPIVGVLMSRNVTRIAPIAAIQAFVKMVMTRVVVVVAVPAAIVEVMSKAKMLLSYYSFAR